jgi:prevent-host-death family protein
MEVAVSPETISVTEFRQNLAAYLARVEAGESFLVSVNGRIAARVTPAADLSEQAFERILRYRQGAWIGDALTPLDKEWAQQDDQTLMD